MKQLLTGALILSVLAFSAGCKKKNTGNPVPEITFLNMTPQSLRGGSSEDTLFLSFRFYDGDGDLGNPYTGGQYDIYMTDSRDSLETGYYFPEIPDEYKDPYSGMKGTTTLILPGTFILPRQDSIHLEQGDTLHYEVYIKDRAGNESNRFTTPEIYLIP